MDSSAVVTVAPGVTSLTAAATSANPEMCLVTAGPQRTLDSHSASHSNLLQQLLAAGGALRRDGGEGVGDIVGSRDRGNRSGGGSEERRRSRDHHSLSMSSLVSSVRSLAARDAVLSGRGLVGEPSDTHRRGEEEGDSSDEDEGDVKVLISMEPQKN